MGQSGMPMLYRLGNSVAALNCDFVKYSSSSAFYQDNTIKEYLIHFLKFGFYFNFLLNDYKFYNYIINFNNFKRFTELLWYNYQHYLIFDSDIMSEIDSCVIYVDAILIDVCYFNVWVLKCSDWLIFNCFIFENNINIYNIVSNFKNYVENYNNLDLLFSVENSFFLNI